MGHQRDGTEARLKGRKAGGTQPLAWQPHTVLPFPSFIFTWASSDLPSRFRGRQGPWESEGPPLARRRPLTPTPSSLELSLVATNNAGTKDRGGAVCESEIPGRGGMNARTSRPSQPFSCFGLSGGFELAPQEGTGGKWTFHPAQRGALGK